jgi:hypothetical protein
MRHENLSSTYYFSGTAYAYRLLASGGANGDPDYDCEFVDFDPTANRSGYR